MITPSFGLTATERVLPRLALDFTTASLDPRITFTRAGNTATVVNSSGVITIVNADVPRFDYDPVTLVCKGLLIEESRQNLITFSTDLSDASWTRAGTPTIISVGSDAYSIEDNDTAAYEGVQKDYTISAANTYTASVFILKDNIPRTTRFPAVELQFRGAASEFNSIRLDTSTGAFAVAGTNATGTVTDFNTYWRVTVTAKSVNASNTIMRVVLYPAYGASSTFVQSNTAVGTATFRYPQAENGTFATSYIFNIGNVQNTRNADVATMTGTNFSSWYNQSEGTVFCSVILPQLAAAARYVQMDDGVDSLFLATGNTTTQTRFRGTASSGVAQYDINTGSNTANTLTKAAGAYKVNNFGLSVRSSAVAEDNLGSVATFTLLRFGTSVSGAFLNGCISEFMFYSQRLTNAELQAITAA